MFIKIRGAGTMMKYYIEQIDSVNRFFNIPLFHTWVVIVKLEDGSRRTVRCRSNLPYLGFGTKNKKLHNSLRKALIDVPPCVENIPLIKKQEYSF